MILRKKKRVENLLGDGPAKREREDPESEEGPRKKRRSGDVAVVVEHCLYISPRYPADVTGLTVSRLSRQRPTRRRRRAEAGVSYHRAQEFQQLGEERPDHSLCAPGARRVARAAKRATDAGPRARHGVWEGRRSYQMGQGKRS